MCHFEVTREERKMEGNNEVEFHEKLDTPNWFPRVRLSYFLFGWFILIVGRNVAEKRKHVFAFSISITENYLPSLNIFLVDGNEKGTKEIGGFKSSPLSILPRAGKITRPTIEEGASSSQNW